MDESGNKYWTLYDAGPRCVRSPVIFLPPASGKADIFFRQIMALSAMGYRTLAVCVTYFNDLLIVNLAYAVCACGAMTVYHTFIAFFSSH